MNETLELHAPEVAQKLKGLRLLTSWDSAFKTLKELDSQRPDWPDLQPLQSPVPVSRSSRLSAFTTFPGSWGIYLSAF